MPKVKLNTTKLKYNEFKELITKSSREDRLSEQLQQFEIKYHMHSSDFYERYQKRQLPDKHDYSVWASIFIVFSRLQARGGGKAQ